MKNTMDNIQEIYSMIMGRDASQFENDPEIRHISFYLCELLFKDCNEISTEAKEVHKEDQNARAALHKLVDECNHDALRNIRDISSTVVEVGNISKPAAEMQQLSHKCDSYAMEIITQSHNILGELVAYDDKKSDNELLNSLTELCDDILIAGGEKARLLTLYEELLDDLYRTNNGEVVNILKENIKFLKGKIEQELYKSFNNNIKDTLKVVEDIRMLGLSTDEEIAIGFIKNRGQYILECFDMIQSLAKENIHRGISEATLTLKTKVYSILLCYRTIFGKVDVNVTSFMRKTIFQFFQFLRKSIKNTDITILTQKHLSEVEREMYDISQSFKTFGFSFTPLLQEIFTKS